MSEEIKSYAESLFEVASDCSNEEDLDQIVKSFLEILFLHRRLNKMGEILEEFEKLYNRKNNITNAKLFSAKRISSDIIDALKKYITQKSDFGVEIEEVIEPEIKNGFVLKYDDMILDFSLVARLKKLREHIES